MIRISFLTLVLTMLLCVSAEATLWGVKSRDPVSNPPATLFSLDDNGDNLSVFGQVTLDGAAIDVDALAQSAGGTLYGFEVADGSFSRLMTIDTTTAAATVVGATLDSRDVRGAMFTADGRLIVLDANHNQSLRIDPATGHVLGSPTALTLNQQPYTVSTVVDLTQRSDGSVVMVDSATTGSAFYDLDLNTGVLSLRHTDTASASDGITINHAGIAASPDGDDPDRLVTYDVSWDDDIFHYDPANSWSRTNGPLNIINGYNAGRGDLAGPVIPEPATLALLAIGALFAGRAKRRT